MSDDRLISRLEAQLSEAEDNIIKANAALSHAKRAKAYWERAIAREKGEAGETPAVSKPRAGLAALVGAY